VVLGDRGGLCFIPPQLVEEVVKQAEITRIWDQWTKVKLLTGKYKSRDLYPAPADPALKRDYEEYLRTRVGK
jgi:hypothetical protein